MAVLRCSGNSLKKQSIRKLLPRPTVAMHVDTARNRRMAQEFVTAVRTPGLVVVHSSKQRCSEATARSCPDRSRSRAREQPLVGLGDTQDRGGLQRSIRNSACACRLRAPLLGRLGKRRMCVADAARCPRRWP